jgi:hypothetical protein
MTLKHTQMFGWKVIDFKESQRLSNKWKGVSHPYG